MWLQATPYHWSPGGIFYGTPLSGTQLNASASVAGTLRVFAAVGNRDERRHAHVDGHVYAGRRELRRHHGDDGAHRAKGRLRLAWSTPAAVPYPTALSAAQLNATASRLAPSYRTLGTVLAPGLHPITVNFTPDDADNYQGGTVIVYFTVDQTTPVVTWTAPAEIVYGTALSETQLNATASVPGIFTYTPSAGAMLPAGYAQR